MLRMILPPKFGMACGAVSMWSRSPSIL